MNQNELMELYREGYQKIGCKQCQETTLHKPIKCKHKWDKTKNVTMLQCTQCGNLFKWKQTAYRGMHYPRKRHSGSEQDNDQLQPK